MLPAEWRGSFANASEAQAERVIAAMEGLPANVIAFVQSQVTFFLGRQGNPAAAYADYRPPYGHTIHMFGVTPREPANQAVLWHEIAHCWRGHSLRNIYGAWRSSSSRLARPPAKDRLTRCRREYEAWLLAYEWGKAAGIVEETRPPARKLPTVAEALRHERR